MTFFCHVLCPDTQITQISANGKFAAGCNSEGNIISLVNLDSGAITTIQSDPDAEYSLGLGNNVSDTGLLVGIDDTNGAAAYYSAGVWKALPSGNDGWAAAHGITSDGTRICGNVTLQDYTSIPVIWTVNADGEFGDYVKLPYPEKDFTGRAPQKCVATWISADGKIVAGQYIDYSGEVVLPIIFK